jgi:hypothetical protein
MTRARILWGVHAGNEYTIVGFTDDGVWAPRDDHEDVIAFEEGFPPGWAAIETAAVEGSRGAEPSVEVCCDRCGRWSTDAKPVPGQPDLWACYACLG